jgi:ceramide glucosyltransferase
VEDEDPVLHSEHGDGLGPNPKIRSMSRAYREAKGDLIWIIDCNVWVAKGVCGRMVDALLGRGNVKRPQKLVHQLPLVVDTDMSSQLDTHGLEQRHEDGYTNFQIASTSTHATEPRDRNDSTIMKTKGGRLEELFMSSAHAKFYTAINTVLIAPCLVGKSNMFRRSHLNALTQNEGIDYFSHNICEDHLVGDLLWKQPVPQEVMGDSTKKWGNHALVFGDLAIQPMAHMSVREYVARRVRWLRVRKYTVPAATGVECTTESFFCAAMLSYALTTLPYCHNELGVPQTWTAMFCIWLFTVTAWASVDWTLYCRLHSAVSIDVDKNTPFFAQPGRNSRTRRPFLEWLAAWFGREALAFPVWFWAVFGGATVTWRGKRFWVDMNMKVHEIEERRALLETGLASVSALGNGAVDRRNARKHQ